MSAAPRGPLLLDSKKRMLYSVAKNQLEGVECGINIETYLGRDQFGSFKA